MTQINLNADLGESYGDRHVGDDRALLGIVTSANLACGFHGGDPLVMLRTVDEARARGVSIGAHPSFPDLSGFGRQRMTLSARELEAVVLYQLAALDGMARTRGTTMTHVKPHGAMSNMAAEDADMAAVIAGAVHTFGRELILLAPALSKLAEAGSRAGLRVAQEIFADRAYTDAGALVPRGQSGAMIAGAEAARHHVLRMLEEGALITLSGKRLRTAIHSICVHGDEPEAVATAKGLRQALEASGYVPTPLPNLNAVR